MASTHRLVILQFPAVSITATDVSGPQLSEITDVVEKCLEKGSLVEETLVHSVESK